jgi:hypothetical protein
MRRNLGFEEPHRHVVEHGDVFGDPGGFRQAKHFSGIGRHVALLHKVAVL